MLRAEEFIQSTIRIYLGAEGGEEGLRLENAKKKKFKLEK